MAEYNLNQFADDEGNIYNFSDPTARATSERADGVSERNRQLLIGSYGGRAISEVFASEIGSTNIYTWLKQRASAGNFAGMLIGDYVDVAVSQGTNVPAQTLRYQIAHFDPYYQCGDTPKGHHIAFVPTAPASVQGSKAVNGSYLPWRASGNNNGSSDEKHPYLLSTLHDWEINDFLPALPTELRNAIMSQRVLLEERYSSSEALTESSGYSWADLGKIWSPSEMEVYGCPVWGTKGYSVGFDCKFALFTDTASRINGNRVYRWLRSVAGGSSSSACYVGDAGRASSDSLSYGWVRPWPCFLIG